EAAHSQLETVLSSTENPVIAVDRQFKIIFANPAAEALLPAGWHKDQPIHAMRPAGSRPGSYREVLADLKRNRTYIYEISLNSKTYLCHIATLERPQITGWVAILNDVTQLKALDRIK